MRYPHPRGLLPVILLLTALLLSACADADPVVDTPTSAASDASDPSEGSEAAGASELSGTSDPVEEPPPSGDAPPVLAETDVAATPGAGTARPNPVTGTLGREDVEGGCMTLTVDGERFELVAGPDAVVVIDGGNGVIASTGGDVIARSGEEITVDGEVDTGLSTFCQVGPVLAVQDVTAG